MRTSRLSGREGFSGMSVERNGERHCWRLAFSSSSAGVARLPLSRRLSLLAVNICRFNEQATGLGPNRDGSHLFTIVNPKIEQV